MRLELTLPEAKSLQRYLVDTLALQEDAGDEQILKTLLNKVIDAQNRAIQETVCPVCQQSFSQEKIGRTGRYCSAACKQKAYRRRRNDWRKQYGSRFRDAWS